MPKGMTHPIFFVAKGPFTLEELAEVSGAEIHQNVAQGLKISGVATLDEAGDGDITFFDNPRYSDKLVRTRAAAVLTNTRHLQSCPDGVAVLLARDPGSAFASIVRQFFPQALQPFGLMGNGIADDAHVSAQAILEPDVTVEAGAVVAAGASIGSGTRVGAQTTIAPGVTIGRNCNIGPQVSIQHSIIGDNVILHPGVRLGQDGFGYSSSAQGHAKIPQVGRVIIQDDVEIGANACVDRGALRDTIIGEGTKIDNIVQIGHNVAVGRHCIIVSGVSLAGSVTLGDFVAIGGHTVVNNHVTIGMGAQIGAVSAVREDVPAGARWAGVPAQPAKQWIRGIVALGRLAKEDAGRRTAGKQKGATDE
jgi:UDP-3-O-[3-hydroxymyristoyl] glucosamine N-acyltransferase